MSSNGGSDTRPPTTTDHHTDTTTSPPPVAPTPPLRRRIRLTLAEIRHLFNVRDQEKHIIHVAMNWSIHRRQHQVDARRRHFTRRLKIQHLALLALTPRRCS